MGAWTASASCSSSSATGAPTIPSPASPAITRFSDHGSFLADLLRGEIVAIPDVSADPRTRAVRRQDARSADREPAECAADGARRTGRRAVPARHADQELVPPRTSPSYAPSPTAPGRRRNGCAPRPICDASTRALEAEVGERTRERDLVWRVSPDLFVTCGHDGHGPQRQHRLDRGARLPGVEPDRTALRDPAASRGCGAGACGARSAARRRARRRPRHQVARQRWLLSLVQLDLPAGRRRVLRCRPRHDCPQEPRGAAAAEPEDGGGRDSLPAALRTTSTTC